MLFHSAKQQETPTQTFSLFVSSLKMQLLFIILFFCQTCHLIWKREYRRRPATQQYVNVMTFSTPTLQLCLLNPTLRLAISARS